MKTLIKMEPLKKQEKQSKVSTINSSSDLTRKLFEFQSNGLDKIYEQLTKNNSINNIINKSKINNVTDKCLQKMLF